MTGTFKGALESNEGYSLHPDSWEHKGLVWPTHVEHWAQSRFRPSIKFISVAWQSILPVFVSCQLATEHIESLSNHPERWVQTML